MTGFLEESPGVRSSSRLFTLLLVLAVVALVVTACVYLLRKDPSAGVIGAWATVVTAVGGCGALIHWKRGDGE